MKGGTWRHNKPPVESHPRPKKGRRQHLLLGMVLMAMEWWVKPPQQILSTCSVMVVLHSGSDITPPWPSMSRKGYVELPGGREQSLFEERPLEAPKPQGSRTVSTVYPPTLSHAGKNVPGTKAPGCQACASGQPLEPGNPRCGEDPDVFFFPLTVNCLLLWVSNS